MLHLDRDLWHMVAAIYTQATLLLYSLSLSGGGMCANHNNADDNNLLDY